MASPLVSFARDPCIFFWYIYIFNPSKKPFEFDNKLTNIHLISFEYHKNNIFEWIHSHFRIFHYVFRRSIVQNPRIIHYCHWLSLWTKIIIQSELIFRLFSAYLNRRLRDFNIRNKNWYAVNSSQFSHGIIFL